MGKLIRLDPRRLRRPGTRLWIKLDSYTMSIAGIVILAMTALVMFLSQKQSLDPSSPVTTETEATLHGLLFMLGIALGMTLLLYGILDWPKKKGD